MDDRLTHQKHLKQFHVPQLGEFACGLACISSVAKFYGKNISQEELRTLSGTTLEGTSMLGLLQAAREKGFNATGFKATVDQLKELDHPVILHVVLDQKRQHYIVLYAYENNSFWLGDPAQGIIQYNENELAAIWQSGALLSIKPGERFEANKQRTNKMLNWIKSLVAADVPILSIAGVLGILMAILGLSSAIFTQRLIDDYLPNEDYQKVWFGFALLGVLLSAQAMLGYVRGIFMARQGRDLNVRIVTAFIQKVLRLPYTFFKGYSTGDLIARMNDSLRIQNTIALLTGNVLISILVILVSISYTFTLSPLLGGFSLLILLIFLPVAWRFHPKILAEQKDVMAAHSLNETQYIDSLTGLPIIKSFGKEEEFNRRVETIFRLYQEKGYKLALTSNQFSFFSQFLSAIFTTAFFAIGAWQVISNQLLLGELLAVITVSGSMIPSIGSLMVANIQIQGANIAFMRMFELADADMEVLGQGVLQSDENDTSIKEGLDVQKLAFRFPGRVRLLDELTIKVPKGKVVALFGTIGSGKSALVNILQRYYEPEEGIIRMNGKMANDISLKEWRTQIGVAAQNDKIFNTTVLDNVCMSSDPNELERCYNFLQNNVMGTLLAKLPQGLGTLCAEEGGNLSGGQRQLISIARAVYKHPAYLILDESTGAMDTETEKKVLSYLKRLAEEKAIGILLVTHRISLASQVAKVYLLEGGKIVDEGPHKALIKRDNSYAKAYNDLVGVTSNTIL